MVLWKNLIMMHKIRNKLNDQSGATLLLAILFFTICAVVGSVVLTGASGVAGRMASAESDKTAADQKTYSLKSAEELINGLVGGEAVYSESEWEQVTGSDKPELRKVSYSSGKDNPAETDNFIEPVALDQPASKPDTVLKMLVGTLTGTMEATTVSTTNSWHQSGSGEEGLYSTNRFVLEMNQSGTSGNSKVLPVYCQFSSDDTYTITARFYFSRNDTKAAAVIVFPANTHVYPEQVKDGTITRKVSVNWDEASSL